MASMMAQWVRNPPSMQEIQETQFNPWVEKIPLEKEMATHSSILAWRIPGMGEPGGLQFKGSQRVQRDSAHTRNYASSTGFDYTYVL